MTISAIQRAIVCRDCQLYLSVDDFTGLLATSGALLLVDGVSYESIPNKILVPSVTLFDVRPYGGFPYERIGAAILAGGTPTFDIAASIITKRESVRTVFRQCEPKPPMGLNSARCRWTFGVALSEEVWRLIIDAD